MFNAISSMKRNSIFAVILIACMFPSCDEDNPIPDNLAQIRPLTQQEKTLLNSSNSFSFELLRMLDDQDPGKNIFFSPIGLGNGIGMSINIIESKPKQELKKFLRITDVDDIQIDRAYYQLSEILGKMDRTISITGGNSLWVNNQYAITELAGDKLMAYYKAQVDFLNFNNENAVKTVNRWASNSTTGKMSKVISEINPHDRAYIINTMHFDISNALPVEEIRSSDYRFIDPDGKSLRCDALQLLVNPTRYNFVNGTSIVDVPLGTGKFHMILVMPPDPQQFRDLIATITPTLLKQYLKGAVSSDRPVIMPALNLNKEIRLKKIFPQLGITEPISTVKYYFNNREIFISDFIHKSSITLGSSLKEHNISTPADDSAQVDFLSINRPFLFIIMEEYTGGIIFNGIITNPLAE